MSSQTDSISRSDWVETYREGFRLGRSERKRTPEKRRSDVADVVEDRRGYGPYSDAELDALQAGYELGRDKAYPGADIDVKGEANTAYDKSGHSPGLSQWTVIAMSSYSGPLDLDLGRQCTNCRRVVDDDEGETVDGLWKCYGCIS